MDVVPLLQLGCAAAAGLWAVLTLALLVGRLRFERRCGRDAQELTRRELRRLAAGEGPDPGEWVRAEALARLLETDDVESERIARGAIRGASGELRYAAVSALGRRAATEDWAVDLLIEALAEGRERAARIGAALERAAPRPGPRLPALLTHPSPVVRFWAVRLLARYPEHRRAVARLSGDASPRVRAAVLETLRLTASGPGDPAALRLAIDLLQEQRPTVRRQAIQTVGELGHGPVAPLLAPLLGDDAWAVRTQAEATLASLGRAGAAAATSALNGGDEAGAGAVRVLQATGVLDELVAVGDGELLERILTAGSERARVAADLRRGEG